MVACDKSKEKAPASAATGEAEAKPKADLEMPEVDAKAASELGEALKSADAHARPVLAAVGLAETERDRLPDPFIEGLEALQNTPPEMRAQLLAKALSESMSMLDHMCGDGRKLMQSLATIAPDQRGVAIYEGCGLEKHGLLTKADMSARDGMMVLMGSLVFDHLSRGGELHAGERAAVEAMVSAPAELE
ncbi:hypothetical protein DB30_01566 [Enhygromyxa salina]|uniref:Uncharacterized protein n=1 Tax=Enhygromyxa salina TaxID=215803 RepID=A0A0C1Z3U5_9BACT|nr:hypothetical protein DB30_01566 [Enhygromyxa salina]